MKPSKIIGQTAIWVHIHNQGEAVNHIIVMTKEMGFHGCIAQTVADSAMLCLVQYVKRMNQITRIKRREVK